MIHYEYYRMLHKPLCFLRFRIYRLLLFWELIECPEYFYGIKVRIRVMVLCLTPLSTILQVCRGVSFIGGGKRSIRRKPPTCRKSLTNFMT